MKKFAGIALLFFVLVSFFQAGCAKPKNPNNNVEPKEQTPKIEEKVSLTGYFPLTKDSTWVYQGEGNEYASFDRKVLYASGNRAQIREDNGGTVSAAVFETSADAITRVFFMGEQYDEKNYLNAKAKENVIILKAPLEVGTTWNESNGTREIVDLKAAVKTPAGNFNNCLKVKISTKNSTLYEYFAKDVGMVKREFKSGEAIVTSTLKSYLIK